MMRVLKNQLFPPYDFFRPASESDDSSSAESHDGDRESEDGDGGKIIIHTDTRGLKGGSDHDSESLSDDG